ncbi:glycosyltransferase family 4 protein [Diaminobutyricibacter sp. McL0608]|uniref:glycosyltransferase family 4 protein n=1 Tax=Leifsonia sp. McL0608 TaxID=3143537 RepID=UPI0031F2E67E
MNDNPTAPLFFLVPEAIDDPARVSGGNVYDQHLGDHLAAGGREVRMIPISDGTPGQTSEVLSHLPDGALVLLDGLIVARDPGALFEHPTRLRLLVLAHMADFEEGSLRTAERVIATSLWTRAELIERDIAEPHRIVVAQPGTDRAPAAAVSATGGRLLCVGVVAPHKGQDLLVRALEVLAAVDGWTCTFVGSLADAPDFVAELRGAIASAGLTDRISFTGVLTGRALAAAHGHADLIVVPSRAESFGMVVTEALARGIPVLATGTGGLPEAIGDSAAGIIVPPDDPWALSVVLRQWWSSPARREALRADALRTRRGLRSWSTTAAVVATVLDELVLPGSVPPMPTPFGVRDA